VVWRMWEALEYYLNVCRVTTDAFHVLFCLQKHAGTHSLTVVKLKMPLFALKIICLCSFLLSSKFGPHSMYNEVLLVGTSVGSLHFVSNLR